MVPPVKVKLKKSTKIYKRFACCQPHEENRASNNRWVFKYFYLIIQKQSFAINNFDINFDIFNCILKWKIRSLIKLFELHFNKKFKSLKFNIFQLHVDVHKGIHIFCIIYTLIAKPTAWYTYISIFSLIPKKDKRSTLPAREGRALRQYTASSIHWKSISLYSHYTAQ